jgi:hypothetical protein
MEIFFTNKNQPDDVCRPAGYIFLLYKLLRQLSKHRLLQIARRFYEAFKVSVLVNTHVVNIEISPGEFTQLLSIWRITSAADFACQAQEFRYLGNATGVRPPKRLAI